MGTSTAPPDGEPVLRVLYDGGGWEETALPSEVVEVEEFDEADLLDLPERYAAEILGERKRAGQRVYLGGRPTNFSNSRTVAEAQGVEGGKLRRKLGPGSRVKLFGHVTATSRIWMDGTVVELHRSPQTGMAVRIRDNRGRIHTLYGQTDDDTLRLNSDNLVVMTDADAPDSVGVGDVVEFDNRLDAGMSEGKVTRILSGQSQYRGDPVPTAVEVVTTEHSLRPGKRIYLTAERAGWKLRVTQDARGSEAKVPARGEGRVVLILDGVHKGKTGTLEAVRPDGLARVRFQAEGDVQLVNRRHVSLLPKGTPIPPKDEGTVLLKRKRGERRESHQYGDRGARNRQHLDYLPSVDVLFVGPQGSASYAVQDAISEWLAEHDLDPEVASYHQVTGSVEYTTMARGRAGCGSRRSCCVTRRRMCRPRWWSGPISWE